VLVEFELEALHKIISYAFFLEKFWDLGLLGFVLLISCINLTVTLSLTEKRVLGNPNL
jgi:hypothetical protein